MASSSDHGNICWLEIPVLSAARAAAFYAAVLGWECDIPNSPSPPGIKGTTAPPATVMATATIHTFCGGVNSGVGDGGGGGGDDRGGATTTTTAVRGAFIQVPEDCLVRPWGDAAAADGLVRAGVLTTFAVGSIEVALERVAAMGGKTHLPKTPIGENKGYLARFIDCEGNLQGIWAQN